MQNYSALIEAALADIESGAKHSCNLTRDCQEARGCPRCLSGLMRGDLGLVHVDVFESGTIRITTEGHGGNPCTVSVCGQSGLDNQNLYERLREYLLGGLPLVLLAAKSCLPAT